ncbi:ABC transporter substrate-binding protein [Bacillus sp. FJAT-29814]|uniref:ABC transporter substrate-binding protein n=1 Tax=Bacillus sp. FJAT-29814 TaxID=1729688 RepID=UPI0008368542|nr:ABC transporter substrate-binding protein [Bacillus sp. FJAT-29814]
MKKLGFLLAAFMLFITGCVKTESDVKDDAKQAPKGKAPTIEILGMSTSEDSMNILRDQLTKNGFEVKLNIQPDYGSFTAQKEAGNYDLSVNSWTTVTGNPDYAVRSLFTSDGDNSLFADKKADELVEKAAKQLPKEYQKTYKELEQHVVLDNAYIVPMFTSYKAQAVNNQVVNESTVRLPKSRAQVWEKYDFVDTSKRATQPLIVHQQIASLTSLDPIKGNDGSINTLNTNMYVRLVNLTDDDKVVSDGSLSLNHAIAEGSKDYYFLLRDDIHFAAVNNKKAVDTGERVGAEDVVFSLNRAKDSKSVPDHRTYSLHENMDSISIVNDLSELDGKTADGKTIRKALEAGINGEIKQLVTDKTQANNDSSAYQVVKITTVNPFPQVLNYLAHQSAGIVSKKQVESINTYDVANFDINKDVPYGDQRTITEGASYNNHLYASGPYILTYKNDYEAHFVKNPAYMPGTEYEAKVNEIVVKFIQDADSALSTLRNGEIHIFNGVPETKYNLVKEDKKLTLQQNKSNGVSYLAFNMNGREVSKSVALRKAILYSVNQDEFISFYQGNKMKAVSTVSPLVDTGLKVVADSKKAKEFLNEYLSKK